MSNVGNVDRVIRFVAGAALIVAPYIVTSSIWANPATHWGAVAVGGVLVATATSRICPLYSLIGVNTCKI